jgi:hypothetical protein
MCYERLYNDLNSVFGAFAISRCPDSVIMTLLLQAAASPA